MKRRLSMFTFLFVLCIFIYCFTCSSVQAATLSDLENHWAAADVQQLIQRGSIGGYPDGTFHPDANITRAEFSKILRQSLGLSTVTGNDFTDTTSHWAVADIHTLVENQIIVPAEYGTQYGPDSAITRREIAIMLVRAMGLNDTAISLSGQETSFSDDAALHAYDKGYLYLAKELGLIGGYEDGSFRPNHRATRAEASVMIVRLLQIKGLLDSDIPDQTTSAPSDTGNPAQNTETLADVSCQLTVVNTERTGRNALGERYLCATMQLDVENHSGSTVTISNDTLKIIVTYDTGAQVTAMQPDFQETIAPGQRQRISTTVSILLPDNAIANMVLGNKISEIQVQYNMNQQMVTFANVNTMLLQAVQ